MLDDSARLGLRARVLIARAAVVHVSAATAWELTIKAMFGKIEIPSGPPSRLVDQGLTLLDVAATHAEGIRDFPELLRRDPFDRLIVAQAAAEGLRLVTADRVLLGLDRDSSSTPACDRALAGMAVPRSRRPCRPFRGPASSRRRRSPGSAPRRRVARAGRVTCRWLHPACSRTCSAFRRRRSAGRSSRPSTSRPRPPSCDESVDRSRRRSRRAVPRCAR